MALNFHIQQQKGNYVAKKLVNKDERFTQETLVLEQSEPKIPGAKQTYSNINMKMKVSRR